MRDQLYSAPSHLDSHGPSSSHEADSILAANIFKAKRESCRFFSLSLHSLVSTNATIDVSVSFLKIFSDLRM